MFKDYYKILGIEQNATTEEIRKAYKTASMKYHLDRNPNYVSIEKRNKKHKNTKK